MTDKLPGEVKTLRILIIESDERECERLLNGLRGGGTILDSLHVFSAEALADALVSERWDAILLNCNLRALPAAEILDTIRVTDAYVPVILIVNRGQKSPPTELLASGAQDFVFKSNLSRLQPVVERECINSRLRRDGEKAIAAVRAAANAMGESEARFLQLAGNVPECFWLTDADSQQVTYVSKGYEQIWGRYVEALYADPADWMRHVHPEDRERVEQSMLLRQSGGLDEKFRVIRPDDTVRWLHARNFPIRDDNGRIISIGGVASDITNFIVDQNQIARLAHYDALTALPNQIAFYDRLQNLIGLARRNGMRLAVMVVDIDRFRSVNETLGHIAGDELLRQVAGRLSGSLREGDTVGRLGGDVFGAILVDTAELQQANVVAQRVIEMLALPVQVEGQELFSTASLGIAFYPQDGNERHELVRNAESAMRRAKELGRNNIQFYSPALQMEMRDRLFLEVDLRNAAVRNEFVLVYQPMVSCANGRITGVEALLRWQHPRRGLVSPDQFIPLLEETNLIIPVGRWVLQTACAQAMAWRQAGHDLPSVSVNLSIRQLQSDSLCDDIAIALATSGLPAACLDVEITESMLMQNAAGVVRTLDALKTLGVTISLDDFGTGYSSLAYLKRFPLDSVKVDRSFVQDITADSDDASITRAVITMAHHLKLKVVAEGVETEGQLALLISHQCDMIQGYFFSRPLPAEQIEELLATDQRLPIHLLRSGTRKPMALFVGVEGFDEVIRQLERDGHRVCLADDLDSAVQWFAGNLADVVVCGPPQANFDALALLRAARDLQPQCERFILADSRHWRTVGAAANDGSAHRLLRLPLPPETLRELVEEALLHRQMSENFDRVSEEAEIAARELVRVESERRRLEEENRSLQRHDRSTHAILQEVLHQLPWPVFGIDSEGMLALVNEAALNEFGDRRPALGVPFNAILPDVTIGGKSETVRFGKVTYRAWWRTIQADGETNGHLLFMQREQK